MNAPSTPVPARIQPKALAWTLGIHALLLLLFFVVKYQAPPTAPPVQELGMEVNLGTDADGSGTDQPERTGDPAEAVAAASRVSGGSASPTPDLARVDDADAPDVAPTPPRTTPARRPAQQAASHPTVAPATTTATTAPPRPQRPRYIYRGSTGPGGNAATADRTGSNEGNTAGPGDRGVPGGTPGAAAYEGSPGTGTGGIGHTLTGRRIIAPRLEGSFRNGGTVRVRVTVNRAGTIVNSTVLSGTGELLALAREKLALIHFSPAPDGPIEQIGTLTFQFKTGG